MGSFLTKEAIRCLYLERLIFRMQANFPFFLKYLYFIVNGKNSSFVDESNIGSADAWM